MPLFDKAAGKPRNLTHRELADLIAWPDAKALFAAAYAVKVRETGKKVSFRGLIEAGNICEKDCYYCGIRKSNANVNRYRMDAGEIVREAEWAFKAGYGSLVIQSGELTDAANAAFFEDVLGRIHAFGGDAFGVTLSLGEQTEETYRRWREAGAHRYLPRICRVDGGFVPPCEVDDDDLEQMMLAFRIVFPQCCMTVSTREAPDFRDRIVLTAADNMSAGSRVTPGGYASARKTETAQFTLADARSPAEVFAAIRANGQEAVFKTWDNRI